MSEPNDGPQQQLRPQTKAEIVAQREQVRMLGIALGSWREAARQCGLSEGHATRKASVSLAERDGDEVVYVSARLKDVVSSAAQLHGWNQPAGVNVNIANIPLPTAEERAEMRALDAKLDALAAKLKG
jgi:hypothetical protein